ALVSAMRTASRLNSSLRVAAISSLLPGEHRSQKTGTEPGKVQIGPETEGELFQTQKKRPLESEDIRLDLDRISEIQQYVRTRMVSWKTRQGSGRICGFK
ncbi:hypothetical protein, partial [Paracoccus sp. MC1862]|uniref:hypothetical protein n=1 Tax=Paracoccus sp. MC1862 TaxID=2760307 RepID=UPI001C724F39